MVAHAHQGGLLTRVPEVMGEVAEPLQRSLEHGDVDVLASPTALALVERQADAERGVHARCDVRNGYADFGRMLGVAGGSDKAGLALNQQVIRFAVAIGAVLAVTGECAIDEASIGG